MSAKNRKATILKCQEIDVLLKRAKVPQSHPAIMVNLPNKLLSGFFQIPVDEWMICNNKGHKTRLSHAPDNAAPPENSFLRIFVLSGNQVP